MFRNSPFVVLLVCAGMALLSGGARAADDKERHNGDERFIRDAAQYSIGAAELSKAAEDRAGSAKVKDYAQMIVAWQERLMDELKQFAKENDWRLPESMAERQKGRMGHVEHQKGEEFDVYYLNEQVKDQDTLEKLFEGEARDGHSERIKEFAKKELNEIKDHSHRAHDLYRELKKDR